MKEYHKIQSVFKRDEKTHLFIEGEWSLPEFGYLQANYWLWTEKVDGTNIRIGWDGTNFEIGGRTENAQIPTYLVKRLQDIFLTNGIVCDKLAATFPDLDSQVVLFGEGFGAKIQKGGGNYIPDGVDFTLFDVRIGDWWLKREDVEGIATSLGIRCIPVVGQGNLSNAIATVKGGLQSEWGDFLAEGLVLRPAVELATRSGKRIITKMKHKDFG